MCKKTLRSTRLDWLLLIAIVGLLTHLTMLFAWPAVRAWQEGPQCGTQVSRLYNVPISSPTNNVAMPVKYLIYAPPDYTWRRKWPLVVYLHGSGARDLNAVRREGLPGIVERGKKFDFVLLSPFCPPGSGWVPEVTVGLIEHISSSFAIDRDRVYLTGYSMGGFGAWNVASYDPARFAAIAPLAGGCNVAQAERLINVPIWAFHGDKDYVVPLDADKAMVDAVRRLGGRANLTIIPGGGHGACGTTYQTNQFFEWLLAQHRNKLQKESR